MSDFASPTRFSRPTDDWLQRVKQNIAYYKSNYGVLFVGFLTFSIVTNPALLISLVFLGGAWIFLLTMRPRQGMCSHDQLEVITRSTLVTTPHTIRFAFATIPEVSFVVADDGSLTPGTDSAFSLPLLFSARTLSQPHSIPRSSRCARAPAYTSNARNPR